jgi:hypothetical protein
LLGLNVRFIFGSGDVLKRTGKQDQKQQHALAVKGPGRIRTDPAGVNLIHRYPQAGSRYTLAALSRSQALTAP